MQSQTYGGLAAYRQFILFIAVPDPATGKTNKFPLDPRTLTKADAHDPAVWLSCDEAHSLAARYVRRPGEVAHGVGFVFTTADPFFFFDLDEALLPSGEWAALAQQLCGYFAGCYVEVSISGTGLHIIGTGTPPEHRTKPPREIKQWLLEQHNIKLELFHEHRFCALTGTGAQGSAFHQAQEQITWLASTYFPPGNDARAEEWTDGPCDEWHGPEDDEELIQRMLASRGSLASVLGARASVRELWEGDEDALGKHYPPTKATDPFDRSDADIALCQHLAFWTGRDCERILRLVQRSGLMRDKWDREDYQQRTILLAVGRCDAVYGTGSTPTGEAPTPVQPAPVLGGTGTPVEADPSAFRDGFQFLGITQQQQHFAGCVYIRESHRMWVPDGSLLKPEQFKATYGGYVFALDLINDKSTRNAWEAFTESMAWSFPKAHEMCFRPEAPPGALIHEEGFTLVNTYVPVDTRRVQGDPAPFLDLLRRLLPNEADREILLSYMAAMVQSPGEKFQWWPVIQGTEGNGKSAVIRILNHAIGNRYTHIISNTKKLVDSGNKFNAWVEGRLFVGLEEIYTPERRDFLEAFKTMVTNDRLEVEGKGANQRMGDNRCNGVMCTNHQDGVPITIDTRRYCIFFTAQQSKEDKRRDGMTGSYFPDLYDWFKGTGKWATYGRNYGYAVCNDFLRTYQVAAQYDPRGLCQEAPETSSTGEAVRASMGGIEQEVIEATEEGRPGFAGGWISSKAFDMLLEDRRAARSIAQNRRRDILRSLGYDWHPALRDGRVDNPIADPAGHGKPRLYIRQGHIHSNLRSPAEVARLYLEAQQNQTMTSQVFGGQQGAA